jgi:hypothetical protein
MTARVHISGRENLAGSSAAGWSKVNGKNMQGIPLASFHTSPEKETYRFGPAQFLWSTLDLLPVKNKKSERTFVDQHLVRFVYMVLNGTAAGIGRSFDTYSEAETGTHCAEWYIS